VIAVDTNILVHAHRRDSVWHEAGAACVRELATGADPWFVPWPCVHEFLAIVTHPRIFVPPSTVEEAIHQVELWLESPSLVMQGESARHWTTLREQALRSKVVGPVFHDARVAAICTDHGVTEIWTADRDFARFHGLKTRNPLVGPRHS